MATPSGKNNPGATPSQFTSSPHPSAVPMGRPLSHKSPSMRTPSASGYGHQHRLSTSSHQHPTPLAATASAEDPISFSSPSALLALGLSGITPSPAGNDVLVGQGINDTDIPAIGISGLGMAGPRDLEEEKRRKLEEVVQLLRVRVAGRGVCREGVERLARLEGFECMWQDNDLTIAGNSVDLEIEFEPHADAVKDVNLKYATPEVQEGKRRDEASAVLLRDLVPSSPEGSEGFWKSLDGFHANLQHLAKLDKLSQAVNCFEAIEGVSESLRRIWETEKQRMLQKGPWEQVCRGSVGRPGMHKGRRIGLSLEYWVERRRLLDSQQIKQEDAMNLDQPSNNDKPVPAKKPVIWSTSIECEEGYPSFRVSKDWVASDVFTTMDTEQPGSGVDGSDTEIRLINWMDPPPTLVSSINTEPGSMDMLDQATPDCRFVAKLKPPVDVPILVASEIYRLLGVNLPQEFKLSAFDGLVVPTVNGPASADDDLLEIPGGRTSDRSIYTFTADGSPVTQDHAYTFHTFERVGGRTLRDLPFSHPRQLADILPILRQYALLRSILRTTFSTNREIKKEKNESKATNKFEAHKTDKPGVTFVSNVSPAVFKLNSMLSSGSSNSPGQFNIGVSSPSSTLAERPKSAERKIDVTLRTPMSASPSILLLFNVPGSPLHGRSQAITVNIEIGLNGHIVISDVAGLWESASDNGQDVKSEKQAFCQKLAAVLETGEDLGLLVEWMLRRIGKKNDNVA
ncbi:hypothetical protein AJ80_03487 [Polytolypa hystricis UAMH7299]|uniref:Mediator of RNA polymerase II transcription subunit 1 n=1 Tax=Polytolypa hystricis (strain UAMH7299) TaxID=1447883 RepID=A0A2B7YJC2_POLH7|nr:hypothetical protein AJ80_03487 [Polytolypa hystricis UAMH7299]